MTVITPSGYAPPSGDQPLSHARVAHAQNWLTGGNANGFGAASGFFEDAPLNTLTYEKWKPTSLPATWVYDHAGTAEVDYCCIAAHTLGSSGCSITVEYFEGPNWPNLIPFTAITTNDPIFILFPPVVASDFRIQIEGGTEPSIGVIKFGKALQLPVATYANHVPDQFALESELRTNQSEKGEFLGRSVERYRTRPAYQWEHVPFSWLSANMRSLQRGIEAEPFFIAWRPDGYNSTSFGYINQLPQPAAMGIRDLYSFGVNMVGHRGEQT